MLASNDFFVDKIIDLIKYGGIMMNFISIAFEMLSKKHSFMIIDAFIYRLQIMYESQKSIQEILNNLEYCNLTNDIINTIHYFCKHNHIRLEIFVDFPDIEQEKDCDNDNVYTSINCLIEYEIDYNNDEIKEKLKVEGENAKLGRMEREIYFKICLSRLFHTLQYDYDQSDFDFVLKKLSKMICVGPIVLD
eukprot:486218_1